MFALLKRIFTKEVKCDRLSFCPSLLDILQFLDYSDILNCRLVNCQINDVIQSNKASMPKPKDAIALTFCGANRKHILVCYTKIWYLITGRHIIIWKRRNSVINPTDSLFSLFGVPVDMTNELSKDESESVKFIIDKDGMEKEDGKCYRHSSMEETLRILLRKLFRLFYTSLAFLFKARDEEYCKKWLSIMGEEFRKSRSVCPHFITDTLFPCERDLLETSGSRILELFMYERDLRDILLSLDFPKIYILCIHCKINDYETVIELMKYMQSCPFPLYKVGLVNVASPDFSAELLRTAISESAHFKFSVIKPRARDRFNRNDLWIQHQKAPKIFFVNFGGIQTFMRYRD